MLSNEAKAITRAVETISKAMSGDDFDSPVKICGGRVYDNVRDMCGAIIEIAQTIKGGPSYPVGAVYISVASDNPASVFGFGEWTLLAPGRTLVCVDDSDVDFNAAGKTGGAKTHTLTIAQMPAHGHRVKSSNSASGSASGSQPYNGGNLVDSSTYLKNTGGGQAHNNLQPYIAVYMWIRTA